MKALKVLSALVLAALVVMVAVVAVRGDIRHQAFRAAVELPAIATYFRLRAPMVSRDFPTAARLLDSQLDLVQDFADGQNSLLPGLLANTAFVMRGVTLKGDGAPLVAYLERLSAYRADVHVTHLWLAQAAMAVDPTKALAAANRAIALIPSDARGHRLALQASEALGRDTAQLCAAYATATAGGTHAYEYNTLFAGVGIHDFGLERADGGVIEHPGLRLGQGIEYVFTLKRAQTFDDLIVHLGTTPGVALSVDGVVLMKDGARVAVFDAGDLRLRARHGFFVEDTLVLAHRDGDTLSAALPSAVEADQVRLSLSTRKLALGSGGVCAGH